MNHFIKSRFAPLILHKHYRNFYIMQTLSQVGKWSQEIARSWIVLELTNSAWALGFLLLISASTNALVSLPAGVFIDRVNIKNFMIAGYATLALASFSIFALVEFAEIKMWHLVVVCLIEGVVMGFMAPAFQVFIVRLVPHKDFQQALILNTVNFHLGRMLGPAVAAIFLAWRGPSLVFLFDSLTYLLLLGILITIILQNPKQSISKNSGWVALKQGLQYVFNTASMRFRMLQLLLTVSIFMPLSYVVYRTYLKLKFDLTGDQFGALFSYSAAGAFIGAVSFIIFSPKEPTRFLKYAVPGVVASIFSVPALSTVNMTSFVLFFGGACVYICFASLTVTLHTKVDEAYRGRMSSLIGLGFLTLGPLISYPVGAIADKFGFEPVIYSLGAIFLVFSIYNAYKHKEEFFITTKKAEMAQEHTD